MEDKKAQPAPEVEMIVGDTLENPPDRPIQTGDVNFQETMMRIMMELEEDNKKSREDNKKNMETLKEEIKDSNKKMENGNQQMKEELNKKQEIPINSRRKN